MATSHGTVTRLLSAWGRGDKDALDPLYRLIYRDLHRMGHGRLGRERKGHTLQTEDLVHEAFLRIGAQHENDWESRGHFFALAARTMRRILVDHARKRQGRKRGGDVEKISLDEARNVTVHKGTDVLALHDALKDLAVLEPRKAEIVELRFFGGLSIEETAECLGVSPGTVMRDWTFAKAWLKRQMQPSSRRPSRGRVVRSRG